MIIDAPGLLQIPSLKALWQEAFGDTEDFINAFWNTAYSPSRCRCVWEGESAVAALYWFDCTCRDERIAYLYAIATAKSHRGKGLCRALMANTHRHLRSLGYAGAVLVPSEEALFAFYEKLGYRVFGHIGEMTCRASTDGVSLQKIGSDEYAQRRRHLLPPNAILQERENLDFLQMQAELYKGEDFLLAARREGESLLGIELLGNSDKAPAILHSLACPRGSFQIPNGEKPFAMYLPLKDDALPPPSYFGLAFD